MKKIKIFSILLSLILIVSCFPQYAFAAETETQEETEPTTIPVSEMPFGTVCIQNGCHTIEGMKPLAGSDKLLDTAQFVLLTVGISMLTFEIGPVHCSFSLLLVCMMTGTASSSIPTISTGSRQPEWSAWDTIRRCRPTIPVPLQEPSLSGGRASR